MSSSVFKDNPTLSVLFFFAALQSLLANLMASILFPTASGLVSVFLISFGMLGLFDKILLKNKDAIWVEKKNPISANTETAIEFLAIFLGVFIVYYILVSYLPREVSIKQFYKQLEDAHLLINAERFADFNLVLRNNIVVLFLFFFFSLSYRAGAIFVVAWNASVWGSTFGYGSGSWSPTGPMDIAVNQLKLAAAIIPHLVAEAAGYILAAMAGTFTAKAFQKYKIFTDTYNKVIRASLTLLLCACVLVIFAAILESSYAPKAINLLF